LKNLKTGRHIVRTATFAPRLEQQNKERRRSTMKKFGFTTVVGSALIAGALGFAGLAQADTGHNDWVHQIQPTVNIPQVDTGVHH